MHLYKPMLEWKNGASNIRPDTAREGFKDRRPDERYRHIAASGGAMTYYVGPRRLISHTFRWVDSSVIPESDFWDMWEDVRDGSQLVYCNDDSVVQCGTFQCGDGTQCGETGSGVAATYIDVTMEQEPIIDREEVEGYYSVQVQMREVV